MRWGLGMVVAAIFAVAFAGPALAAEVTGAADNLRTGWYPDEPSLAPARITKERFKQVFNKEVHGQIYAQPLVANGTLLVVTEEDWAYGLDPLTGSVQWEKQFGTAVEAGSEASGATIKCPDIEPRVGITGTPVIDTEHNVAYFVANSYKSGATGPIAWYLHAVELGSGGERPGFPVEITGEAQNVEKVKFEPLQQLQRPALLLQNGVVYAAFGSHCDRSPYEGWIVGVSSEGKVVTKWVSTAHGGSIWQTGGGLVSDGSGQILFSTGNDNFEPGVWDPPEGSGKQTPAPEGRLGEAVVRVEVQTGGLLATRDYFSPFNSKVLDEKDLDLGSSMPVGLPSPYFGNTKVPHLALQGGKAGTIYLLNRDGLGGRGSTSNNVVQELGGFSGIFGSAGVWPGEGGYVDIASVQGHLHFFKYGEKSGEPALVSETKSSEEMAFGSGSPIVTSNGATSASGVLWINWCPKAACKEAEAELRAYNPASPEKAKPFWQEKIGFATKFSRPDASNGHIYIGNRDGHVISFGFKAPAVVTGAASSVTQTTATLNATVNPNGSEISECKFEYGTSTAYGSSAPCASAPGSGTVPVAVSASVTGLTANTTYHFRVIATNAGGASTGSDQTFKTLPNAPAVVTGAASAVTQTAATLNATVNPNGGEVSECKLEYGTTTAYGSTAACTPSPGSGESPVAVSASVSGLAPGTGYHFRVSAANAGGASIGSDQTFTTGVTETAGGQYYSDGVLITERTTVIGWGTLALATVKGGASNITCHTATAGTVANEGGVGAGSTQVFASYDCESTTCPAENSAKAENLPWPSSLTKQGTSARSRTTGIAIRVACTSEGGKKEMGAATFVGSDQPSFHKGTSALHPSDLEFDVGSGELEEEGSLGSVTGKTEGEVKMLGFGEQELINVK